MKLKTVGLVLVIGLIFQANWFGIATAEELRGHADKNIKEAPILSAGRAQILPVPHASTAKPPHSENISKQMSDNEKMQQEIKKQKASEEQKENFKDGLKKLKQSDLEVQKMQKDDIGALEIIINKMMLLNAISVIMLVIASVMLRLRNQKTGQYLNEKKNSGMVGYPEIKRRGNRMSSDDNEITKRHMTPPDNEKSHCIKHDAWIVVGASVTGRSHLKSNPPLPCQDSHIIRKIFNECGVAVVCDGAGSAANSHFGSAFAATKTADSLEDTINRFKWYKKNKFPSPDEWHKESQKVFSDVLKGLDKHSKDLKITLETLACTVISVIYSPAGILIAHIGDGRAAYCNREGEWKAMMTPFKGEEANQTVFITTSILNDVDMYMESRVVKEDIAAFALMSDGCESHSFEVNIKKAGEEERYYDPNKPYDGFFNPLIGNLQNAYRDKTPDAEIGEKWKKFIEAGNKGLMNELDDKTMIVGTLVK